VLHQNTAEGGLNSAQGGGVFTLFAATEIDRANFTGNEARQLVISKDGESTLLGGLYAYGGALCLDRQVLRIDVHAPTHYARTRAHTHP
jgi:hypothetical protein